MTTRKFILCYLAAFFIGLAASMSVRAEGDPAIGLTKAHMCIGCHNIPDYAVAFPNRYKVPKIQGQSFEYIKYALAEYAAGTRYTTELNRLASMPAIAASLSDQDIEDLAAYYSSLEP